MELFPGTYYGQYTLSKIDKKIVVNSENYNMSHTLVVCLSPIITRLRIRVKSGIVALTEKTETKSHRKLSTEINVK